MPVCYVCCCISIYPYPVPLTLYIGNLDRKHISYVCPQSPFCSFFLVLTGWPRYVWPIHIFGSISCPYAALIFTETDIQYPMQAVLDPSVGPFAPAISFCCHACYAIYRTAHRLGRPSFFYHRRRACPDTPETCPAAVPL